MIESINLEIDNFLSLIPNISREQTEAIKTKYSSNVTDDLSKGPVSYTHLTLPTNREV